MRYIKRDVAARLIGDQCATQAPAYYAGRA